MFASSFCATSSAGLFCFVTTILRRSSMFLDDFDDDAELPMIDA